jgi:kynurenine formamidase
MALLRRHGDVIRPDGGSAANELIVTGGHIGTHIDALAHVSHNGVLHGGCDCMQAQEGGRFSVQGVDTIAPMVCPGVLLDVAAIKGVDVLPGGYGITAEDMAAAADHASVRPERGGVCVIRTGWARNWSNATAYIGHDTGVPGLSESAAYWLVEHGVIAAGADTAAFEQVAAGQGHRTMPVHRVLLVEHGVHIIEHMSLEILADSGATRFLFMLSPLKIVGGTGSPVRPLAVISEVDPC